MIYVFLIPVFRYRYSDGFDQQRSHYLTYFVLTHAMTWFLTAWVFFFGACLGSFLNVVAYRIPSGLTILGSSRCPFCFVPIERRYNLPIIGWFLLRGRCAACRLPISPRYFVVEIIAGLLLVWLVASELVTQGANLPSDETYDVAMLFRRLGLGDFSNVVKSEAWSLVRIFSIHAFVAYTLLTAALMKLDRFRLPLGWKSIHLLLIWLVIVVWPTDFEFAQSNIQPLNGPFWERIETQFMGTLMGIVLGLQFCKLGKDGFGSGLLFALMLIGSCCGIEATLSTGLIFLLLASIALMVSWIGQTRNFFYGHPLFLVLAAFLLQIGFWHLLDKLSFWPGKNASSYLLAFYLLPILILSTVFDNLFGAGAGRHSAESEKEEAQTLEEKTVDNATAHSVTIRNATIQNETADQESSADEGQHLDEINDSAGPS